MPRRGFTHCQGFTQGGAWASGPTTTTALPQGQGGSEAGDEDRTHDIYLGKVTLYR